MIEDFPWEYKGGGYWRAKGVPKGVTAEIRHADQVLEEFLQFLAEKGEEVITRMQAERLKGEVDLSERGTLERRIAGAIKSCIDAHGPISKELTGSAAKRVISTIKTWNREQRELPNEHEMP